VNAILSPLTIPVTNPLFQVSFLSSQLLGAVRCSHVGLEEARPLQERAAAVSFQEGS
jgi:hypothetical protein